MAAEESRQPEIRISDADRDAVVAQLRMHCTEGRITLDEFSDRVGEVYNARTPTDLDRVLRDLPVPWSAPSPAVKSVTLPRKRDPRGVDRRPGRRPVRWMVALFGDSRKSGRFRLDDESSVVAIFGDCVLDISEATIDRPEVVISAVSVFGDVVVVVPEGIEVDLQGFALFGDRSQQSNGPVLPGSPVVVVRALAVFGDVRVRPPRTGRPGRWRERMSR